MSADGCSRLRDHPGLKQVEPSIDAVAALGRCAQHLDAGPYLVEVRGKQLDIALDRLGEIDLADDRDISGQCEGPAKNF